MDNVNWKIVSIVALVIVIIGAIGFCVFRVKGKGKTAPSWVMDQPIEAIDTETMELITKSLGEWKSLGEKGGMYKNPSTGKYTMTVPMVCGSCGQKIPPPADAATPGAMLKYKCPECGKPALVPPHR